MGQRVPAWAWWSAGGAALLLLIGGGSAVVDHGADSNGISRDPKLLLPVFATKLAELFRRMRNRGFDPILFEGYRTPARAAALAVKGTGKADSTHSFGAGADIISQSTRWSNPAFFTALGQEAETLGLTWGGRFGDLNHVQAVSYADEAKLRATALSARNAFVATRLA